MLASGIEKLNSFMLFQTWGIVRGERENFTGLALGCIEGCVAAEFSDSIYIEQLSPSYTHYMYGSQLSTALKSQLIVQDV